MAQPLLKINDLFASVDDKLILKNVNLELAAGETHVLMGPNGTGKSTFGHVVMGDPVYTVNGGSIEFDGQDITGLSPDKRSRVPLSSFLRASVAGREGADLKGKQFRKLLKDLCEELDMDPAWLDRELGVGFSGGEKKKVEMLQLLLLQPKLAILDETDSGLDVDALGVVSRGMEAYRRRCNGTLMVITHNTRILEHLNIDCVHVMMGGHMIAEGDASMVQSIDENGFEQFAAAEAEAASHDEELLAALIERAAADAE